MTEVECMKRKDFINLLLLTLLVFIVVIFCIYPNNLFGSTTDWGSQHTMFPEYFRNLFYQTGDLYPDFMPHLGAGQNIYNISYYGLLNPIVLISYFFPFIKMVDFMVIAFIVTILISIYLCYYWLLKKNFSRTIVMTATILFACASPLIFHAHRHIMFMTYMPYLLLGLIGIDAYFEKGKRVLFTLSVLGMILTSYYYSIGGILVLVIYGVSCYLKKENTITIKKFIKDGLSFLWPIILGIGLSAILLLPTAYVIATGRSGGKEPIALSKLLLPHLDIGALVYSSYSIGLSAIALFSLFHLFLTKKREHIFLGISLFVVLSIPIFMYMLNGFLYVRAKVLIPFLPLFIYLIALLLKDLENKKVRIKIEIPVFILLSFFWYWRGYQNIWFYVDVLVCLLFLCAYSKWQKKYLYMVPMTILAISMVFVSNRNETYEKKIDYQNAFHSDKVELLKEISKEDSSFYRSNDFTDTLLTANKVYTPNYYSTSLYSSTFHQPYKDFFYDKMGNADTYRNRLVTSSSNNIFFETLMNVKYVVSKKGEEPVGYELVKEKGKYGLYKNENVYPLGYVSDKLYQESYYETLKYPYNVELLMNGIVVENKGENYFESKIRLFDISYLEAIDGLSVSKIAGGYKVEVKENIHFDIPLSIPIKENEILMITFQVAQSQSCKKGDLTVAINSISNKLTCKQWMYHNGNYNFEFAISGNEKIDHLSIYMSKGTFEIIDINHYVLDYSTFKENSNDFDPFIVDTKKTQGDKIEGTIDVTKDGYFVLSIPYDKSFQIKVDGVKQEYEKANEVFIGFPLTKGNHKIEIVYEAPFKKVGMIISIISVFLLGWITYQDRKIGK